MVIIVNLLICTSIIFILVFYYKLYLRIYYWFLLKCNNYRIPNSIEWFKRSLETYESVLPLYTTVVFESNYGCEYIGLYWYKNELINYWHTPTCIKVNLDSYKKAIITHLIKQHNKRIRKLYNT